MKFITLIIMMLGIAEAASKTTTYATYWFSKGHFDVAKRYLKELRDQGSAEASYVLGMLILEMNPPCEEFYRQSNQYFSEAAALGYAPAIRALAESYLGGYGVSKDETMAFILYTKAAELGDGEALFNLAVLYKNGCGVERSLIRAINLFEKASHHEGLGELSKDAQHWADQLRNAS